MRIFFPPKISVYLRKENESLVKLVASESESVPSVIIFTSHGDPAIHGFLFIQCYPYTEMFPVNGLEFVRFQLNVHSIETLYKYYYWHTFKRREMNQGPMYHPVCIFSNITRTFLINIGCLAKLKFLIAFHFIQTQ